MKHTPGPWRADKYCVWAGDKYVAGTMTGLYDDEQEGNAAIIAAAPEMYRVIEQLVCMTFNYEQLRELITEAHKIFKKVRGEGDE